MNRVFGIAFVGIALLPLNAAPPTPAKTTKSSQSKSSQTKSAKASPGKPGTSHRKVVARSRRATPRPTYQLHPDPERYQQIQQALADRGYFKGQVNGQWGDDSVDALRRFQADQKLLDDGKISALTLTGLGLGPKHDGVSTTPAAAIAHPDSADSSATPAAASPSQSVPPPDRR